MQKAIFKSQLLRANSQPELKAMASALEPLLNLCSMENTYRGGGGGFEAITSIVAQFIPDGGDEFLLMDNGFNILVSLFSFNLVQKIALAGVTLYVLKHVVMLVVSTITNLAFKLLGTLLESGLKFTLNVFKLARKILVVLAILLIILHLFSKIPDIQTEVQPYLAPCMAYVDSMLTTMREMTAKDVIDLTAKAPGTLVEAQNRILSGIMEANPSEVATQYTSKLWTLLQTHIKINVSNVSDIITQIESGQSIVTLREGLPVLSAEILVVIELMRFVLSEYFPGSKNVRQVAVSKN